jgi:multicomponent Na+:H+ antiporter subunit B
MELNLLSIYIFLSFIFLFGGLTVCINSAFATTLAGGMFSTACAILYFFLNAPDVSMTEASVGVFFTTAVCLMTVRITRVEVFEMPSKIKLFFCIFLFFILGFYIYKVSILLGEFGNLPNVMNGSGGLQLLSSYRDFHIPNVITTVLASYRSFDTMGETVIILTSAIGIFLIINLKNSKFTSLN